MVFISLADDGDDLVDGALAEGQEGVKAGTELADVAGAEEEFMRGDFGVGGGFAESWDEELRPALHREIVVVSCECRGVGGVG